MNNLEKDIIKSPQGQTQKELNYEEVVLYLDSKWDTDYSNGNLGTIQALDKALGSPSKAVNTIHIGGTNGKTLTTSFAAQLFREEGITVGCLTSPHTTIYNERIATNGETIPNKLFTELANTVINTAKSNSIDAKSGDIITMMALLHFKQNNIDVALLESTRSDEYDPINICSPKVVAVTRITEADDARDNSELSKAIQRTITSLAKPNTWLVSSDQSKLTLQAMANLAKTIGAKWAMPIRKLAQLEYPFEQLHGRCAALAERIVKIYAEEFVKKDSVVMANSLLLREKGRRGRPTLEAKKLAELNPAKTVGQFWTETAKTPEHKFQVLEKEVPTVLLDNASNVDAIENLLLGVRLIHYKNPIKGLVLIASCNKNRMNTEGFIKAVRYFFRKTAGQLFLCPLNKDLCRHESSEDVNLEDLAKEMRTMKIKAEIFQNFSDAYETAKKTVDGRDGLIVISGSQTVISEYVQHKQQSKKN